MAQSPRASSNFIWPPVVYGGAFLLAYAAGGWQPLPFAPAGLARVAALYAGLALLAAGFSVALVAEMNFLRAGTATLPTRPARVLVRGGIYRFTRNPMYLGMSLMLAGLGLAANSAWYLLTLPLAMILVFKLAIEREERYLEQTFGREYLDWKARVRRWI